MALKPHYIPAIPGPYGAEGSRTGAQVRYITLSARQTKTNLYANSADPDETSRNEPSHQDLHCLPFGSRFLTDFPICNNGGV